MKNVVTDLETKRDGLSLTATKVERFRVVGEKLIKQWKRTGRWDSVIGESCVQKDDRIVAGCLVRKKRGENVGIEVAQ